MAARLADNLPNLRAPMSRAPVYGVCADCGAVAWELLLGKSDYCLGCAPEDYRDDDGRADYWDEDDTDDCA